MKNWTITLLCAICTTVAIAQADTPAYKRNPTVPPLSLLQVDSTVLTKEDLKKQPTLIMYFSPTCDHCQHQWADMVKNKEKLKHIQIIMATMQPFEEMEAFYKKEQIASYPNIRVGQDAKFTLPPFYRMNTLPYQALYDKQGHLITTFEGNVPINKLIEAFGTK